MRPGGPVPIAPRTTLSVGFSEAKRRVLNLYREWLREVPHMVNTYPLDLPIHAVRARIRREFERYRYIQDLSVIDRLILNGTQELIETHSKWKQKTHILTYFDEEQIYLEKENERKNLYLPGSNNPPSKFLYNFLKRGGT